MTDFVWITWKLWIGYFKSSVVNLFDIVIGIQLNCVHMQLRGNRFEICFKRISPFYFLYCSKSESVPKMAKIISGLAIAKEIRQELKEHIIEWENEGHRAPHLTAVLIGDDPASHTYVNNKIKVRFDCSSLYFIVILISLNSNAFFSIAIGCGWSWHNKWNKTLCINNHRNHIVGFDQSIEWRWLRWWYSNTITIAGAY